MVESDKYEFFFERIQTDARIGMAHIAVFTAVYSLWIKSSFDDELKVFPNDITSIAKVSNRTYYRTIIELSEYGYLLYEPSFKRKGSRVIFN
ncbi:hypothetical protein J7E50_10635 [Pedobacter sp. ISL-68]|uniref:hypothetical protein n=1 Tax=Pedobacter sp. ISL-68 TaxID=2819165 RepID=UPI001BE6C462|nr:hypothetical protein [Pedobacter sp. ISL-68]MBT2590676.1 hypothetical protein [Pedobacter sp. ISL-68]